MTARRATIAMACDRSYLYPLAVAASSLIRHSSMPVTVRFGLAADWPLRLSGDELNQVLSLLKALGAEVEPVVTGISVHDLPPTLYISPTAFVKLALLDECREGESLVWFDADLIALRDWTPILEESRGFAASGVHEAQPSFECVWPGSSSNWYVNTGVVAVDGSHWHEHFAGRWLPLLHDYSDLGFRYLDQDVLNALIRDEWNQLPQTYNFRLDHSGPWCDPAIVHFAGWWKPWLRIRRQMRLLAPDWHVAFQAYAEAERVLLRQIQSEMDSDSVRFWYSQRQGTRGLGSWRAYRHYLQGVRGVMSG